MRRFRFGTLLLIFGRTARGKESLELAFAKTAGDFAECEIWDQNQKEKHAYGEGLGKRAPRNSLKISRLARP